MNTKYNVGDKVWVLYGRNNPFTLKAFATSVKFILGTTLSYFIYFIIMSVFKGSSKAINVATIDPIEQP